MYDKDSGSDKDLEHFKEAVNMIRRRHVDTVPTMAQAVFKLNSINNSEGVTRTVQYFLDRLYTNRSVSFHFVTMKGFLYSRISIHILGAHYNALLDEDKDLTGMVGTIEEKCDILGVCYDAYEASSIMCDHEYFDHPKLKAIAVDVSDHNEEKVTATYVPSHLHHILFEIFKVYWVLKS